jgi:hypothetical protein
MINNAEIDGNGNVVIQDSDNSEIIINMNNANELKGNFKAEQKLIAHHRIFELTDGLIKLATDAFRPIKINDPKSFADYLNETIDRYKEFVDYFDSNEILFEDDVVSIVHSIRDIIFKCIIHQRKIENFKAIEMPWKYITSEIKAINEIYYNQIEKELPEQRERLKEIIRNK